MGLVSVVIPTRNRAAYLEQAIRSVLGQTYPEIELIVVNDGSTDGTSSLLSSLQVQEPRISVVHLSGEGASAARNAGIKKATGEYIAFLDDDDLWLPRKLERQIEVLERDRSIGLVYAQSVIVDEKVNARRVWPSNGMPTSFKDLYRTGNTIPTMTVVVRGSCLKQVGGFDTRFRICQDYDLWLRIANSFPVKAVTEVLAIYRHHQSNISAHRERTTEEVIQIFEQYGNAKFGISRALRIRRVAEERMATAAYYRTGGCYFQAAVQYLKVLLRYPTMGLLFWWPEVEGKRLTAFYRLLKPYTTLILDLLRSLQQSMARLRAQPDKSGEVV